MPVADQQKGKEPGQFPEEGDLDEISGQDNPQHRPHKRLQEREKTGHGIGWRHIIARVETYERSNDEDEHCEQPSEAIKSQRQIEVQGRNPSYREPGDPARANDRIEAGDHDRTSERIESGERGCDITAALRQEGSDSTPDKRQNQDEQEQPRIVHVYCVSFVPVVSYVLMVDCSLAGQGLGAEYSL